MAGGVADGDGGVPGAAGAAGVSGVPAGAGAAGVPAGAAGGVSPGVAGVPAGAVTFGAQPDPRTIEAGAEVNGKTLGKGTYKVSDDGRTLTVTSEGEGLNGPFKTVAVFERVVPDPYLTKS